jgi:hypothetical protein
MQQPTPPSSSRLWHDSAHASLCLLGAHLRAIGFFRDLEAGITIRQKSLRYTPAQKLEMFMVSLLAGASAVSHSNRGLRVDQALQAAFGLPGCADQSVIADTLDAATPEDVAALRTAIDSIFGRFSRARRHDHASCLLTLDVALSPLPASRKAERSERGYFGRCRSKTGRKLVRVRAALYQETIYEEVCSGKTAESLPVLQRAIAATERLLGMAGESVPAHEKRTRTEVRLDSSWGSDAVLTWLLERGYQVTGKVKSFSRTRKLTKGIKAEDWQPTSSEGREAAAIPEPIVYSRPVRQFAVRTPSQDHESGYDTAVLFTTRTDLEQRAVVDHYDDRAGMEADLKGDKHGLALGVIRKQWFGAQQVVVLLIGLAHNLLIWSRRWLADAVPRVGACGIVRLVQEVWAVPGRVKVTTEGICRVRLTRQHPRARDVCHGFQALLPEGLTLGFLG